MTLPEGDTPAKRAEIKLWLKERDKFMTGFCNENGKPGQHEGHRPQSSSGVPMKTCPFWDSCPCKCHYEVDQLFAVTGMERIHMENPEWNPPRSEFIMPEKVYADPLGDASVRVVPVTPDGTEHVTVSAGSAATTPLAERRTSLGYAAAGTLEAQVWHGCSIMLPMGVQVTTIICSEWIGRQYNVPPPSRGAIQAVWKRWETLGFGEMGNKPVRLAAFTGEGTWAELESLKSKAKRDKKSTQAAAKRGSLRPRA